MARVDTDDECPYARSVRTLVLMFSMLQAACIVTSSARTYETCEVDDDCNSLNDRCRQVGTLMLCTRICTSDDECPDAAAAGGTVSCGESEGENLCLSRCTSNEECEEDYVCDGTRCIEDETTTEM